MTPAFAITSLREKIQLARMCTSPSRCFESSFRQVAFAASATTEIPIIRFESGSLPWSARRATSRMIEAARLTWKIPPQKAARCFAAAERPVAYSPVP